MLYTARWLKINTKNIVVGTQFELRLRLNNKQHKLK
jgi:hypothetical protein